MTEVAKELSNLILLVGSNTNDWCLSIILLFERYLMNAGRRHCNDIVFSVIFDMCTILFKIENIFWNLEQIYMLYDVFVNIPVDISHLTEFVHFVTMRAIREHEPNKKIFKKRLSMKSSSRILFTNDYKFFEITWRCFLRKWKLYFYNTVIKKQNNCHWIQLQLLITTNKILRSNYFQVK